MARGAPRVFVLTPVREGMNSGALARALVAALRRLYGGQRVAHGAEAAGQGATFVVVEGPLPSTDVNAASGELRHLAVITNTWGGDVSAAARAIALGPGFDDVVVVGASAVAARDFLTTLGLGPHRTHRLDVVDASAMDRLARVVSGRGVGLVLGGGGARTFAHLGALAAFRDAGVPIDLIGGCSGGAIFAGQHALGWSIDRMREAAWQCFVARGGLLLPTFPLLSLISERPFLRILQELFGDARIEDLPIPYFCVSTNLTRRALVVYREGLLRAAVRASMSVPGVAPPHVKGGEVFVDGCVLDPLPVATMRQLGAGVVIGVDVSATDGPSVSDHLDSLPSLGAMLWERVRERMTGRGASTKVVYWWNVALASALAGARRDDGAADLVVRPALGAGGHLDFRQMDTMASIAYRDVTAALGTLGPWPYATPEPPPKDRL